MKHNKRYVCTEKCSGRNDTSVEKDKTERNEMIIYKSGDEALDVEGRLSMGWEDSAGILEREKDSE